MSCGMMYQAYETGYIRRYIDACLANGASPTSPDRLIEFAKEYNKDFPVKRTYSALRAKVHRLLKETQTFIVEPRQPSTADDFVDPLTQVFRDRDKAQDKLRRIAEIITEE